MKNTKKKILISIIILCIIGCLIYFTFQFKQNNLNSSKEEIKEPAPSEEIDPTKPIKFKDENLEKAILEFLKKDSITPLEAEEVTYLYLDNKNIENIQGLENFSNLEGLVLDNNNLNDIKPISNLYKLRLLAMNHNLINDLTPVEKLVNLEVIELGDNQIKDIKPLLSLKKLHFIPHLDFNPLINLHLLRENIDIYHTNNSNNFYLNYSYDENGFDFSGDNNGILSSERCYGPIKECTIKISKENDIKTMDTFEEAINEAKKFVQDNIKDSMSDYEKEITIVDYLVKKMHYESTDGLIDGTHDYYYPLVLGYGQCHNYAQAFNLLAYFSNLESYSAVAGIAHEWNLVKIDGKFYHVDITWADAGTEINYDYINVSTEKINKLHGSECIYTPTTSTKDLNISTEDYNNKDK